MLRALLIPTISLALVACAGQSAQVDETTPEAEAGPDPSEAEPTAEEAAPAAAAVPCSEDEDDVEPGSMATVAQSDRVWAFVRGYIEENSGELAGTFDIPGDEHGLARLQSFRPVSRTSDGFSTAAEFTDADHTFEVTFVLRGQCDLEVTSVELASIDGASPSGETAAVASSL